MEIKINNPDGYQLEEFCNEVIKEIRTQLLSRINFKKLSLRDDYLNSGKVFTFVGSKRYISTISIIHLALNNLVVKNNKTHYLISINENLKVYGTDNKLVDIVKLIEYGNQELPPYMVFRDTFDNIDVEELFRKYLDGENLWYTYMTQHY